MWSEFSDKKNSLKQAGAVLGQAQIKLELELNFSSLKISCIKRKTKELYWLLLLQSMTTTNEHEFLLNLPTKTGKRFQSIKLGILIGGLDYTQPLEIGLTVILISQEVLLLQSDYLDSIED